MHFIVYSCWESLLVFQNFRLMDAILFELCPVLHVRENMMEGNFFLSQNVIVKEK